VRTGLPFCFADTRMEEGPQREETACSLGYWTFGGAVESEAIERFEAMIAEKSMAVSKSSAILVEVE
jgi:hypothetical protein